MLALELDPRELASIQTALDERPAQAGRALVRAINKTLTWAVSQGLRAIARENDIPLKALRGRRRGRKRNASRRRLTGTAWFGTLPVRASDVGAPRQTRAGARAGKHFFDRAFVARVTSGHIGIFKRAGHSRLPILEQVVRLQAADKAIEGVARALPARLETTFAQEFNFEVNVRGQAQ
jgi:hypothetical protein